MAVKRIDQLPGYSGDMSVDDIFPVWKDADSETDGATLQQVIDAVVAGLPAAGLSAFANYGLNFTFSAASMAVGAAKLQRVVLSAPTTVDSARFFWGGYGSGDTVGIAIYEDGGTLIEGGSGAGVGTFNDHIALDAEVTIPAGVPVWLMLAHLTGSGSQTFYGFPSFGQDAFEYNATSVTTVPGTRPSVINSGGDTPIIELYHS